MSRILFQFAGGEVQSPEPRGIHEGNVTRRYSGHHNPEAGKREGVDEGATLPKRRGKWGGPTRPRAEGGPSGFWTKFVFTYRVTDLASKGGGRGAVCPSGYSRPPPDRWPKKQMCHGGVPQVTSE